MHSAAGFAALSAEPQRLHCRRFAAKHKRFLARIVNRAAPTVSRRDFGKEKGAVMKFATVSKSVVLGLALLLAASAFAGTKANLSISNPLTVNGTTLKPGDYKVQWEGNGPNVELNILQGKNVVAKVSAHVVELQTPAPQDATVTLKNDSGPNSLTGIRFQGKKIGLELDEARASMQAAGSSQ
jgi:hypothetical protein